MEYYMDEIIKFMNEFIKREYEAFVSSYTEKDEDIFEEKREAVDNMYYGKLGTIVNRDPYPDELWFDQAESNMKTLRKRTLFQIKQYEHSEYGHIYGCYVSYPIGWIIKRPDGSESLEGLDSYHEILYVAYRTSKATGETKLRLISQYLWGSKKYTYGSMEIEPLGEFKNIVQFQPPKDSNDLEEYEANKGRL
jgi:hypothetical protein